MCLLSLGWKWVNCARSTSYIVLSLISDRARDKKLVWVHNNHQRWSSIHPKYSRRVTQIGLSTAITTAAGNLFNSLFRLARMAERRSNAVVNNQYLVRVMQCVCGVVVYLFPLTGGLELWESSYKHNALVARITGCAHWKLLHILYYIYLGLGLVSLL